jgi:hypothetical protein
LFDSGHINADNHRVEQQYSCLRRTFPAQGVSFSSTGNCFDWTAR